jgi:hypothetical protein
VSRADIPIAFFLVVLTVSTELDRKSTIIASDIKVSTHEHPLKWSERQTCPPPGCLLVFIAVAQAVFSSHPVWASRDRTPPYAEEPGCSPALLLNGMVPRKTGHTGWHQTRMFADMPAPPETGGTGFCQYRAQVSPGQEHRHHGETPGLN